MEGIRLDGTSSEPPSKMIRLDGTPEPASIEVASIEPASIEAKGGECMCYFWKRMIAKKWSRLRYILLPQIFACLPAPEIVRLKCMSNEWMTNLTSRGSAFKRVCAEVNKSNMFAIVSEESADGDSVSVKLYHVRTKTWHSYVHHLGSQFDHVNLLYPGDGGLMCVICTDTKKGETPSIIVLNPLDPGRYRVLPDHALMRLQMVQLVMDWDRRSYKVLAVGETNDGVVAKVFSSMSAGWDGEGFEDLVFGHQIICLGGVVQDDSVGPCGYDSEGRQLLDLVDRSHPLHERSIVFFSDGEHSSACYALVKDHLFVLHDDDETSDEPQFCISEYQGQKCQPHWVKLKTHRCKEFERPPRSDSYKMSLYASQGFLLVKADNAECSKAFRHVLMWLYDLATENWQAVPPFADKGYNASLDAMFQLQWDVDA